MKKLMFIPMFALLLFSMAIVSSANAITLDAPAQDASISGVYSINSTLDTNTLNITDVTFYYKIGAGSWVTIGTTTNTTVNQLAFNKSFDTTGIVDDDDLTFNVTAYKDADDVLSTDTSTGVDIDNGNPTSTLSSSSFTDNLALISSTSFTVAINADSTIGISSCKVYFTSAKDNSIITKSVSASANACTTTTTPTTESLGINEVYTVIMEATDGNGDAVNSSSRTLRVTPASGGGGGGVTYTTTETPETPEIGTTEKAQNIFSGLKNNISNIFNSIKNFFSRFL